MSNRSLLIDGTQQIRGSIFDKLKNKVGFRNKRVVALKPESELWHNAYPDESPLNEHYKNYHFVSLLPVSWSVLALLGIAAGNALFLLFLTKVFFKY